MSAAFVSTTAVQTNAAAFTITVTANIGEVLILAIETDNEVVTAVSGYTLIDESHEATTTATRITLFYRVATGDANDNAAIPDTGNHQTATVTRLSGVKVGGLVSAKSSYATNDSLARTIPGVTTTAANSIVLGYCSTNRSATNSANFSGYTNANLTSLTERFDESVTTGAGGGFCLVTGIKATTGATGGITGVVTATNTRSAMITIALIPNDTPTVALNSPADAAVGQTLTPTLAFTGTDADGDTIQYQVEITDPAIDFYAETNQDALISTGGNQFFQGCAQAFHGANKLLGQAQFYLKKVLSPTGNAVAKLYAETHPTTFGNQSKPTGAALATSNTFDVSTLTTSLALVTFTFPTPYQLVSGTDYCIAIEYTGGDATNYIQVGYDNSSPTHVGNGAEIISAAWSAIGQDFCFYLYEPGGAYSITKASNADAGFADITNGADTDPFASGDQVGFTVQAGNILSNGNTYSWRVRGLDPSGTGSYGAWSATRTFTTFTTANISDSDTGAAVDAGESIALADSDDGAAVDTEVVGLLVTDADTGTAVDAGESIAATITDDDTATAAETTNFAPSVVLDSPADAATVSSTTPTLAFTGTDVESDDIRYKVEITSPVIDHYVEGNYAAFLMKCAGGSFQKQGQSFHGTNQLLGQVAFYLKKTGSPTGNVTAYLYAHTGTFGAGGTATGSPLATSTPVAISTIDATNAALYTFTFPTPYQLAAGTDYCIVYEYATGGDASNYLHGYVDTVSGGGNHPGNQVNQSFGSGTFGATAAYDVPFYLYEPNGGVITRNSNVDSGFLDVPHPGDTDPFASGDQVQFTIQGADARIVGLTYSWRVRGCNPTGPYAYGPWTAPQTFTVSSSTPISDSDTGTGVDAGESIAVTISDADTATATDDVTSIALADNDPAAGVDAGESIAATLTDADTGTAVDTETQPAVLVSDADTAAGVDAGESIAATLTDADTATGVDAGESVATTVTDADTATGVESESIAATLTDADSGTAVDTELAPEVAISDADTGSAVDAGESISVTISDADTATATETESLVVSFSDADTATGIESESILATVTDADSATAVDTEIVALPVTDSDTATATETESVAVTLADGDTGTALDAGESIAAALSDTENATGIDSGEQIALSDSDSATATETEFIALAFSDADSGTATETESLVVYVSDNDTATAVESETLSTTITDSDVGSVVEAESLLASLTDFDTASAIDTEALTLFIFDSDSGTAIDDGESITFGVTKGKHKRIASYLPKKVALTGSHDDTEISSSQAHGVALLESDDDTEIDSSQSHSFTGRPYE